MRFHVVTFREFSYKICLPAWKHLKFLDEMLLPSITQTSLLNKYKHRINLNLMSQPRKEILNYVHKAVCLDEGLLRGCFYHGGNVVEKILNTE